MGDPEARYASGTDPESGMRAGAPSQRITETHMIASLSCCGLIGLGAFAGLVVLLNCIHRLGPEDQVLVEGPSGPYVLEGPSTVVIAPERKKTFRQATQLGAMEYAVVKNVFTGELRHYFGPGLFFLGAYDVILRITPVISLQRDEYLRLVGMTGFERVEIGPQIVVPQPLESFDAGVEKAPVVGEEIAVLTQNRTTGILRLVTQPGYFFPRPYEEILEMRQATLIGPKQYAVMRSHRDAALRTVDGPTLFQVGAYEELVAIHEKMILRKDEYVRLRDKTDGSERVVRGPTSFIPKPSEQTLEGKQRATFLNADTAALVLNRETGQQHLITEHGVFMPSPYEQVLERRHLIRVLQHEALVVRDAHGQVSILGGGTGEPSPFFLQPYWTILEMTWSDFADIASLAPGEQQTSSKKIVSKIDTRAQKLFFRYGVFTSDNVKLILEGTVFWQVKNIAKMMTMYRKGTKQW